MVCGAGRNLRTPGRHCQIVETNEISVTGLWIGWVGDPDGVWRPWAPRSQESAAAAGSEVRGLCHLFLRQTRRTAPPPTKSPFSPPPTPHTTLAHHWSLPPKICSNPLQNRHGMVNLPKKGGKAKASAEFCCRITSHVPALSITCSAKLAQPFPSP